MVGPMGAGKTTIGRALAKKLGRDFIDVDEEIIQRSGVDIPWIFEREGEAGFRERERCVIEQLAKRDNVLIATGGGAILAVQNRQTMANTGTVIYLHATLKEQVRRTSKDSKRPLLAGGNRKKILKDLMAQREPLYRELADVVIETDRRGPRVVVRELTQRLENAEKHLGNCTTAG